MNKEIFKTFIKECAKEDLSDWAETRGFNLKLVKSLSIGKCTPDAILRLKKIYGLKGLEENGFLDKNRNVKYYNRLIIPFTEDYFSARNITTTSQKFKNLFPKGLIKRLFYIEGKQGDDLFIAEGETDAIRLKQEFKDCFVVAIGGSKSANLITETIKKIILLEPRRIVFAFDNDLAGIEAKKYFLEKLEDSSKRKHYEDKLYVLRFKEDSKDIDEYFDFGGKKEDLTFEKIELKKVASPDSIYNNSQKIRRLDSYLENVQQYWKENPFFYDRAGIFWFWNKELHKYELWDEVDVMVSFDNILGFEGQTVNTSLKSQYLEAFKRVGRSNIPRPAKKKWIQFKDKAFSIKSDTVYEVKPNYFFTNPIPWDIGSSCDTPVMDKLFTEWVGESCKQTLYEIMAYCCYTDYQIQTIFSLYGSGRNGKTQFQRVVNKFIGASNVCSTELDVLLDSRFEAFKLYKKLVCSLGETNFGVLKKTSLLKKLVGGDLIGYEKKGKDPFDDYNYAKIIIASNSLPSSEDTSDGFMRRWLIIDFPNEFNEGKDVFSSIPEQEYSNLALKVTKMLPKLLKKGVFFNQGTIPERKERYMLASNPLPFFINNFCVKADYEFISYNKLYTAYVRFLRKNKRRKVKMSEFKSELENEGYYVDRTTKNIDGERQSGRWIEGLALKEIDDESAFDVTLSTPNYPIEKQSEGIVTKDTIDIKEETGEIK